MSSCAPAAGLLAEAELQLAFARLNLAHFGGALPAYRIRYNRRLTAIAGRIRYRPPVIELSAPLLQAHPGHAETTLLHEMIHAWLHLLRLPTSHGRDFKRKMREVGLTSIYHSMPTATKRRRAVRFRLICPRCGIQLTRARKPAYPVSCARCFPKGFDSRAEMRVERA